MIDLVEHYKAVRRRIEMRGREFQQLRNPAPKVLEPTTEKGRGVVLMDGPDRPKIAERRPVPNHRNARSVIEPILIKHEMDWKEVASPIRRQKYVSVRREIIVALRDAGWSLPMIGRFMGRDHTTILHALKSAKEKKEC